MSTPPTNIEATPMVRNPKAGTSGVSTTTAGAPSSAGGPSTGTRAPSAGSTPQVENVGLNVLAAKISEGVGIALNPLLSAIGQTNNVILQLANSIAGQGNVGQQQQQQQQQPLPTPGGQMIALGAGINMTPTPARPGFALPALDQPLATRSPEGALVLRDGSQLQMIETVSGPIQPTLVIPPGLQALLDRANRQGLRHFEEEIPREIALVMSRQIDFNPIQVLEQIRYIWNAQTQDPNMMMSQGLTIPGSEQQWFATFLRSLYLSMHQAEQQRPIQPLLDAINQMRLSIEDANRQQGQAQINPGQPAAAPTVNFGPTNERLDRVAQSLSQQTGLPVNVINESVPIRLATDAQGRQLPLPVGLNYNTYRHLAADGSTIRSLAVHASLDPGATVSVQNVPGQSLDVNVVNRVVLDYNDQNHLTVSLGITAANPLPVSMNIAPGAFNIGDVNAIDADTRSAIVNSADYLNPYRSLTEEQLVDKFKEMGLAHYAHLVGTNRQLAEKKLNVIAEMPEYSQNIMDYNRGKPMFADQGFDRKAFDLFVKTTRTTSKGVPLEQTYRYLPKSIPEAHVKFDGKLYNLVQGGTKFAMKNFRDIERLALKGGDYAEELETFREIRKGINTKQAPMNIIFKAKKW